MLLFVDGAVPLARADRARCGWRSCCLSGLACSTCSRASTSRSRAGSFAARGVLWLGRHRSASGTTPPRCARRCGASRCSRRRASCSAGSPSGSRHPRAPSLGDDRCARRATRSSGSRARSTSTTSSATSTRRSASTGLLDARLVRLPRSSGRSPRRARFPESSVRRAARRARPRGTATTRSPTSSSAATSTISSAPTDARSSATASRPACCSSRATRSARRRRSPALLRELSLFAETRGLQARGARRRASGCGRSGEQLGLRSLYLGDEAVVETAPFSLEGRAIRKVASRSRGWRSSGYTAELAELGELDEPSSRELDAVSRSWRAATPNAASRCRSTRFAGKTTATASSSSAATRSGRIRGFLHFAPSYGRRGGLALAHAPRPRHAERPDGVPRRSWPRAARASAASRRPRSTSRPSRASSTRRAARSSASSAACC